MRARLERLPSEGFATLVASHPGFVNGVVSTLVTPIRHLYFKDLLLNFAYKPFAQYPHVIHADDIRYSVIFRLRQLPQPHLGPNKPFTSFLAPMIIPPCCRVSNQSALQISSSK